MPTTLTLKNIPEGLYETLKETARANHRSLNGEAIAQLEQNLMPQQVVTPDEWLARARRLRAGLNPGNFSEENIQAAKEWGRK